MSTVSEVKNAVERLSPEDKSELFHWLTGRLDFQAHNLQELRQEIAIGIAQADQNDLDSLDIEAVKKEARERLSRGK